VLKEIKDAEADLSFSAAMDEVNCYEDFPHHRTDPLQRISLKYTLGKDLSLHAYHVDIITKNFTRSVLPEILDEFTMAFAENTNIGSGSYLFVLRVMFPKDP
jgi:hypothetical protein